MVYIFFTETSACALFYEKDHGLIEIKMQKVGTIVQLNWGVVIYFWKRYTNQMFINVIAHVQTDDRYAGYDRNLFAVV